MNARYLSVPVLGGGAAAFLSGRYVLAAVLFVVAYAIAYGLLAVGEEVSHAAD